MAKLANEVVEINISAKLERIILALTCGYKVSGDGVDGEKMLATDRHHGDAEVIYRVFCPKIATRAITFYTSAEDAAWAMLKETRGNSQFTIET